MFALVLVCLAMIGVTAVLSRQVVTGCGVAQGEVDVRSSATSAGEVGGDTLLCDGSLDGNSVLDKVV